MSQIENYHCDNIVISKDTAYGYIIADHQHYDNANCEGQLFVFGYLLKKHGRHPQNACAHGSASERFLFS